ncbi:MAG: radical SAM protein [Nitrospirae bacterium]|nr:radical SAM protein [Nitrospirota bacterium]
MNILILNPPQRDNIIMVKEGRCMQRKGAWGYIMSPITIVTMGTLLRNNGHIVTIKDCPASGTSFSEMLASIALIAPDIVYINTSTPTIDDDIYAAKCIKKQNNHSAIIVLFGIHPSCQYPTLLTENCVDFCIIGEPEYTALDLAASIKLKSNLNSVAGIAFLDNSEKLVVTTAREPIINMDNLPMPDWSFIDTGNYRLPLNNEKFLLVNTNRGCPYRCTFCNAYVYYGRTPRRRSVATIIQELKNNVELFGITNFMFWAEEFILDKKFVLELCHAIINAGLSIKWVCNSRVDAVDPETMTAIRRAGCWNIAFGIESGNQSILNMINKKITLDQIRHAVSIAKNAGLQVTGHVIIGFPNETRETISNTEQFVKSLALDFVQYYCAIPYPGTQLYTDAINNNWLTTTDWRQFEHNISVLNYPQIKAKEIMKIRRQLMLKWYLSPKKVINTLINNISQPSDLFAFISKIPGFLRWI